MCLEISPFPVVFILFYFILFYFTLFYLISLLGASLICVGDVILDGSGICLFLFFFCSSFCFSLFFFLSYFFFLTSTQITQLFST